MAIVFNGYSGPFVGRLGPAVGYMWKNKNCVRAYCRHINYPNTVEQQKQRNWFVGMVRFASQATDALKLGFRQQAIDYQMTEGNYFVMCNKQHFVRGGNEVNVNYNQLQIAAGTAADVWFKNPKFEEGETVVVDFEKNSMTFRASSDDQVYVYVYAPALESGYLSAPVSRRSKSVRFRLPEAWSGVEVHLYGFVVDKEGRSSNSTYIGVGRVNHYEERGRYIPLNKNWKEFVDIASELNSESSSVADDVPTKRLGEEDKKTVKYDLFGDPPEVP